MAGQEGGAAFILVYIGCVLLLGIPCMISEFIIGRHGASNTARAYTKLSKGKAWKWVGYLEVLTGFLITGYYAVVSGWCLQYVYASIMGELQGDPTFVAEYFKEFSADPIRPVMWTVVIFLICHFVIIHGVRGGIEKASKIMMPVLFILLLIIVVAACLLPNAGKGVEFLLKPDFSKVDNGVSWVPWGSRSIRSASVWAVSVPMLPISADRPICSRQLCRYRSSTSWWLYLPD